MQEIYREKVGKLVGRNGSRRITSISPMAESGSSRKYFRVTLEEGSTLIACLSENIEENKTFIRLTEYLLESGINVPEILGIETDYSGYLLEDLGDIDFMSIIRSGGRGEIFWQQIERIMGMLVKLHRLPERDWKEKVEYPPLGKDLINYDFNYCLNNFVEASGIEYDKERLKADFKSLESRLTACPECLIGLMYRDFQSRNIMIKGEPYFIDYQSARKGPGIYDLASFAWQAKACFTPEEREKIIRTYIKMEKEKGYDVEREVKEELPYWATFRIIQTLGAYGLRGLKEGKRHFIESIPSALHNLTSLMKDNGLDRECYELYRTVENIGKIGGGLKRNV